MATINQAHVSYRNLSTAEKEAVDNMFLALWHNKGFTCYMLEALAYRLLSED